MTRETWISDLRNAEEILQYCGEAMRNDEKETKRWKFMYWLAVAVYHLLMDRVRTGVSSPAGGGTEEAGA